MDQVNDIHLKGTCPSPPSHTANGICFKGSPLLFLQEFPFSKWMRFSSRGFPLHSDWDSLQRVPLVNSEWNSHQLRHPLQENGIRIKRVTLSKANGIRIKRVTLSKANKIRTKGSPSPSEWDSHQEGHPLQSEWPPPSSVLCRSGWGLRVARMTWAVPDRCYHAGEVRSELPDQTWAICCLLTTMALFIDSLDMAVLST